VIRGVKNGPSPEWLQDWLKAVGLRPISALVDVTNFVSLDRGRPLHVFDAMKLKGDLRARFAKEGETARIRRNTSVVVAVARRILAPHDAAMPRAALPSAITTIRIKRS